MGYKIEPTGFRMSLTKKCASPCFLCIGFRFYLLVIGFTLWLLGLILAPISIRNADLVLVWSANALLVAGSLLLTLGVTGWILYLWEIELDVRTDLFKRMKQKEARSPDVTKPPSDVNGTHADVIEMTNGVIAVPVPVRSQEPGAANQGNKLPKLRRNRKVESERGDSEKTEGDTGTSNNVQSRVHNDVHLNRTSSEMTVPLLAESRQNQKSTEAKTLKTNAAPDAREPKPGSGKAGTVTKGLASSKGGPSPKQPSVVPVTKQRDPVSVNTTASPLPKGNVCSGNKVSPEPREEVLKPTASQRLEKASEPTVQPTLNHEITTPNITQTLLKPTVSPTSKDSVQRSSASTEPKQTPDDEPVPKRKVSTAKIKLTATNTPPKDPNNVSAPIAQKRRTKTKRKMSKSPNVSNSKVSPMSEEQAAPKSLGPEESNVAFVPPNSESKEIASDPFPTASSVPETQPAVPKSTTAAPRKGNKVRESTLSPKGVAAVHKPTVVPMQKQSQVPRSTVSDAGQPSSPKETVGPKLGLKEVVVPQPGSKESAGLKPAPKEIAGPKPESKETTDSKHGSKELVGQKPGLKETAGPKTVSKETAGPKPTLKETVVPQPGSKETAGPKPGSKETTGSKPGSKETGGSKPGSKETVGPKPQVEETVLPPPGSKETVDPKPGPKETVGPKTGPKETSSPKPGSKETAGSKPRSKETVGPKPAPKETAGPKPGSKETADPKPGSKETVGTKPGPMETAGPKPGSKETADPKPRSKLTAVPKSVTKGTVVSKPGSKETDVSKPGSKENEVPKSDSKETAAKKPGLKDHTAAPKETERKLTVLKSGSKGVVSKLGSNETNLTRYGSKEDAVPTPGSKETAAPKPGSEETVVPKPGSKEVPKPGSKEGSPGSPAEMAPVSDELRMPSGSKPKDPNLDDPKTQINKGSEIKQKKTVKTVHMNGGLRSTDQKLPPGKGQTRGLSGTRQKSGKVTKDKLKNRPKSKKGTARPAVNSAELKKVMVEARSEWGPTRGTNNCLAVLAIGQNANGKKVEKGDDSDKQEKPRQVSVTCPEPSGSSSTPTSTHAKDITKVSI